MAAPKRNGRHASAERVLREPLGWPLDDRSRLEAACRMDALGVRALTALGGDPRAATVTLTLFVRAGAGPARATAFGTAAEIAAALGPCEGPVILDAIEARAAPPETCS